jgi:hypothetical protein
MKSKKIKLHYIIFFTVLIVFLFLLILWNWNFSKKDQEVVWGVTFSKLQAEELGLDWVQVYGTIIDEMNFKTIRLPIYWPDVEKQPGKYDFSSYGWMVEKAAEKNIEVMPVLGRRVPRWPECHVPEIYKDLSEQEIEEKIFNLITAEVKYFKKFDNIKKWQVDNEPFADFFGECPVGDTVLVEKEISIVKVLDDRPIVITESGELSWWVKGSKISDILGVSMYRNTWNKQWGWFNYPLPPAYYWLKSKFIKIYTDTDKVINTELQVEPWARNRHAKGEIEKEPNLKDMTLFDQLYSMDISQVKKNVEFAKKVGFAENYLWGVEWWYWIGQKYGHWEFWQYGQGIE